MVDQSLSDNRMLGSRTEASVCNHDSIFSELSATVSTRWIVIWARRVLILILRRRVLPD